MFDYNNALKIVNKKHGKPDSCKEFDDRFTFIFNPKSDDVFDKGLLVDVAKKDGTIGYPNMFDMISRGDPNRII